MSQRLLFHVCNTNRKDQFLIDTRVVSTKKKVVIKRALNELGITHVQKLVAHQKTLSALEISKSISITDCRPVSDREVAFSFVEGKSYERVALQHLINSDEKSLLASIQQIITLIDLLPSKQSNPNQSGAYNNVFSASYDAKIDCAGTGLVDINLDNVIVGDDGSLHLIDYEWVFDFPVPKDYLRTRVIYYFATRHQEALARLASKLAVTELFGSLLLPTVLFDHFQELFTPESFKDFIQAESSFQNHVSLYEGGDISRRFSYQTKPRSIDASSRELETLIKIRDEFNNMMPEFERHRNEQKKLKEDLRNIKKQLRLKEQELSAIKSDKVYRAIGKARRIRNR